MRFGLSVSLTEKTADSIKRCGDAGITAIKIRCHGVFNKDSLQLAAKAARESNVLVYLAPYSIDMIPAQADPFFEMMQNPKLIFEGLKAFLPVAERELKNLLIGINPIDGIRHAVRAQSTSKFGIKKSEVVQILEECEAIISGVAPFCVHSFFDDISANFWSPLKFDIYDCEGAVSRERLPDLINSTKRVWMGSCSTRIIIRQIENRFYQTQKSIAGNAVEYAFVPEVIEPTLELLA